MPKVNVGLRITRIGMVVMIWDKVLFKLRVYFGILVSRKKIFSESIHHIQTHLDVVVDFTDFHISVYFEFYLYGEVIDFLI